MSRSKLLIAVSMAALLVTAGCLGSVTGPRSADAGTDGTSDESDAASVSFYVSDRPGAIDQFEHLNVTITAVGFHQADGGDTNESDDSEPRSDGRDANESETDGETTETPVETTASDEEAADANETATGTEPAEDGGTDESEDGSDGWVTYEVDNRTVDLTELQGANASRLADFDVAPGEYDRVFVYVGDVRGTLTTGETVNVQLPSDKLQLDTGFTANSGSNVSFVFDIMVHEAGNSGQYILRPVIGESGTGEEVEIRDVDGDRRGPPEDAGPGQNPGDDEDHAGDENLELSVDGAVRAGETVTVAVTGEDGPVANATVTVDGEVVGTTGADGTIELTIPDGNDELSVTVTAGDAETAAEWPVRGTGQNNEIHAV